MDHNLNIYQVLMIEVLFGYSAKICNHIKVHFPKGMDGNGSSKFVLWKEENNRFRF